MLCAITTEKDFFHAALGGWASVMVGSKQLRSPCRLCPAWWKCVGLSNIYRRNCQGNSLIGSERRPSCSCKLLEFSLCFLLLQMFSWVTLQTSLEVTEWWEGTVWAHRGEGPALGTSAGLTTRSPPLALCCAPNLLRKVGSCL